MDDGNVELCKSWLQFWVT